MSPHPEHRSESTPSVAIEETSKSDRWRSFQQAIDEIRDRTEAKVGPEDLEYIRKVAKVSKAMEVTGRGLIFLSPEPVSFFAGVTALWIHKQLEATEIGHTALHGAYDRIEGAGRFRADEFRWETPIDEESWRYGHNIRHHQYTNIAGKDPDIHFGHVRLTEHTPHSKPNSFQLPFAIALIWPNFLFTMNAHFTGLIDVYFGNGRTEKFDFIKDRSPATVIKAHRKAFRKYIPYYAKNYIFYPALAGPLFGKVLLGNWMADTVRNVYTAATIFCGHVGDEVRTFPAGSKARGRGEWYAMQVEATQNFDVSWPLSVLCGALDLQIEHHLFPRLPPNRLREISPDVEAACAAHGVRYRKRSWPRTLLSALQRIQDLSHKVPRPLPQP